MAKFFFGKIFLALFLGFFYIGVPIYTKYFHYETVSRYL